MSDKIHELSDAIRMGAAITKPALSGHCYEIEFGSDHITKTCAIGAAAYATDGEDMDTSTLDNVTRLVNRFPHLAGLMIKIDGWPWKDQAWHSWDIFVWWNYDNGFMSREQIADELRNMGL